MNIKRIIHYRCMCIHTHTFGMYIARRSMTGSNRDQQMFIQNVGTYSFMSVCKNSRTRKNTTKMKTLKSVTRPVLFPSSVNLAATFEFLNRDVIFWFWMPINIRPRIKRTV